MDLNDADLRDLAAFLARRMTTEFAPIDPMDAPLPGVDRGEAWRMVLTEARDGGWLPSLVSRVASAAPDDPVLQETCRLLHGPRANWPARLGGVLMVGAAMAMMALVVGGMGLTGALLALEAREGAPVASSDAVSLASDDALPVAIDVSVDDAAGGLPGAGDDRLSAVAPTPAPAPDGGALVAGMTSRVEDGPPEESAEPGVGSLSSRRRHLKCHGRPGEAVGYFYAGRHSPGNPGDTHVAARSVNVRVAYPSEANGWDKGARIHCVLRPGDQVTLSAQPIELPGGHYWVPVYDGDVEDGDAGAPVTEVASL